jgi:hypothetical protein
VVPAGIAATVTLPELSLVDGTVATDRVRVHSLGGYLLRRTTRMSLPLDPASAAAAHRTEKLYRVRQHLFRPAFLLASLYFLAGGFRYLVVQDANGTFPWWVIAPLAVTAIADELFESYVARSALTQHPRTEKNGVRMSGIPDAVAQEITRLHPEISTTP